MTIGDLSTANNAAEFEWKTDDVFGRIASRYGFLCDIFSFGIHRIWKQRVARRIASEHMSLCMPVLGWLATGGDASAYKYLLHGIRDFPTAEKLAEELRAHGFEDVSFERLSLGIVAIHTARKPKAT
ncbi:MAG TPA: class I SAM-dependent methyltransferase [Steroidobacteraceae bacterium]|nr:class I SAM-dependent methyltransferase [Steroidobacteraceae bacterium]